MARKRLKTAARRQLVRDLVIAGVADHDIVKELRDGIPIKTGPHQGQEAKATPRTVRADLALIAEEMSAAIAARQRTDRDAGVVAERLARVAADAADAGKFGHAIRGNLALLDHLDGNRALHETSAAHVDAKIDRALRRKPTKGTGKRGARGKLTRQVIDILADSLRLEMTYKAACQRARISVSAFYSWQEQGRRDILDGRNTIHVQFLDAIESATAEAQASALATVWGAINDGSWQAAFRMLECRNPDQFARRAPIHVQQSINVAATGPVAVTVNLSELAGFSPEQLRALAAYDEPPDVIDVTDEE